MITFLPCINWHNAMDHNKFDTNHLVWALTWTNYDVIKILSIECLVVYHWYRCDFRHNQLSIVRFSFIFVRRTLLENLFLNFVYLNSAWEVAMVVSSQLKTMKPHLWHIEVIPYVHRNFLWNANMGVGIATDYCHFVQRWVNMVSFKLCMK